MNGIDLNIDNYSLINLLDLFKLDYNFTLNDLKQAKKIVLRTHPDKSNLSKDYFLFFSSAYKIIYAIYEFRSRSNSQKSTEYIIEKDEEKELLLKNISKQSNFNKIFNELFEKNHLNNEFIDTGYGDWLKSDEDINKVSTTLQDMNNTFEQKKEELKSIIIKKEITEFNSSYYDEITGDKPENYSSGVFSTLQYEDLRKAHVETVIPITNEDYVNRIKFKNTQELSSYRNNQDIKPLSQEQAKEYMKQKDDLQNKHDVTRAFKLAKEDEIVKKLNNNWMSGFKQLKY